MPIVEKAFEHSWVADVELQLRFRLGHERVWLWRKDPHRPMHWDAPIAISVFRNKRGKRRVAFCFSIYIVGGNLHIKQIQGIFGTDIPSELRAWPKIFIETCRTFACQETLREVRVARADSLYSYHTPSLRRDLLPDARQRSLERIRKNMTLLYDANALELGFVADGIWFKWPNPSLARQRSEHDGPRT